jgi:lipid II:glycine glycyltransferase (peptidoglycan interpeptide bridge formation enzyme)
MIRVREVDADIWAHALGAAAFVPLQQSAAYGTAIARRGRVVHRLLIEDGGSTVLGVQALTRAVAGIPALTTALRGPFAFADAAISAAAMTAAIGALQRRWPHALIVAPELADDPATHALLRTAKLRCVMSPAAVIRVALDAEPAALRKRLDQKWRNRLVKAEAAGLKVEIARGGASLQYLLNAHERLMRAKRFKSLPSAFVQEIVAASARRDVFVCTAELKRTTVAGALFLRHGDTATYVIAANEAEGRAGHAGNLLLWRGLLALREAGVKVCDLGLVDTDRSPALARFKLGAGGTIFTPCGTWTPSPV